jgi:hypothetical protein
MMRALCLLLTPFAVLALLVLGVMVTVRDLVRRRRG